MEEVKDTLHYLPEPLSHADIFCVVSATQPRLAMRDRDRRDSRGSHSPCIPFVQAQLVAFCIQKDRHAAHRGLQGLDQKRHLMLPQAFHKSIEVINLERQGRTFTGGLHAGMLANAEAMDADLVFKPVRRVIVWLRLAFKTQHLLIEATGTSEIIHGEANEGEFNDSHGGRDGRALTMPRSIVKADCG